jgi:hypothetical protein
MQSLNIFGTQESICFTFQSLEEFEIYLEKIKWPRAHMSVAQFCLTGHLGAGPTCTRRLVGHHW